MKNDCNNNRFAGVLTDNSEGNRSHKQVSKVKG